MTWCYTCKDSLFPKKDNGDFIPNDEGIIEGKCLRWDKIINVDISACNYGNESKVYKTAKLFNDHNNKILKEIGIMTKSRYEIVNKCPHCFSKDLVGKNIFRCKKCNLKFKNPLQIKRYPNYQRRN